MSETDDRNIIRIDDLEQPIFRIYSKERFLRSVAWTSSSALETNNATVGYVHELAEVVLALAE